MVLGIQSILAIIFFIIMFGFLVYKRKNLSIQKILFPILYVVLYRTRLGLNFMDKCARKIPHIGYIIAAGVIISFLGMGFICFEIIRNSINLLISPEGAVSVQPVLPFEAKGVFFVPFVYWILSIFIIASVHEFSHGTVARYFRMKLKSSGFAFLCLIIPVIPAAFVEPDEKKLAKASLKKQLGVFAAGPFSNIITSGIVLLIVILVFNPVGNLVFERAGVEIVELTEGGPSLYSGLVAGDVITDMNSIYVPDVKTFVKELRTHKAGEIIYLQTNKGVIGVTLGVNPADETLPWIGISSKTHTVVRDEAEAKLGLLIPKTIEWVFGFCYWLFLLSLGIGLFNLLPMGPLDGGLMMRATLKKYYKNKGIFMFRVISWGFFILILANLAIGFIR